MRCGADCSQKLIAIYESCCRAEDRDQCFPVGVLRAANRYYTAAVVTGVEAEGAPRGMCLLISHKVFLSVFVWTIIAVLIALSAGVEVLVTLLLIGLLIVRELTDGFLTAELRRRMDLFIYAGLVLFVVVVLRRVWLVLS